MTLHDKWIFTILNAEPCTNLLKGHQGLLVMPIKEECTSNAGDHILVVFETVIGI
ncbi:hypothetical protein DPMN_034005 [Dreissena polymorpha]|uniref:Uncharacterized protein n=1 Tax=Dreissena polymorpha TaxID=45954 RepID=A0A9D4M4U8_DREPO|nr:hypothetical protein DPMN_034005 [Dreissena polymorpha]